MIPRATADFYRAQQRRGAALVLAVRRLWAQMSPEGDWDAGWASIERSVLSLTIAAQLDAAEGGASMVSKALQQTGYPVDPVAQVDPSSLAGYASDGRPLKSLLSGAVPISRDAGSLRAGESWLATALHLQVADAGRVGSSLAIATRPGVGWTRMVNPPCCQDCALLAERFYRWSAGFARHLRCDCVHRPAHEEGRLSGYRDAVPVDMIRDLTAAQRQALDEGADFARVVNAYRRTTRSRRNRMATTNELAGRGTRARLTPEGIYARAKDREEAVQLLRTHGYIR